MTAGVRIAMWSGPRNLSTAMMYAFASRGDCTVWDEPFYAPYLRVTGIDHPMRDQIIAGHEADPEQVALACKGPVPQEQSLFYQKHMTVHMIPGFDRFWMRSCRNVFLIRDPDRVVASYSRKREDPTLADLGYAQQAELFDEVADWSGRAPLVIDSADILENPGKALASLCAALGISYTPSMLHWAAGPKPFDGIWAAHWYNAVHLSTGFGGIDGGLPPLSKTYRTLADQARPFFDRLSAHRL